MKWEPADVIRLSALVGGFLLCGLGAILMWLGIGAEGAVDIKSSVMSGSVKTGSAGLFILFFGAAIVMFVLATLAAKATASATAPQQRHSKTKSIGQAFAALLVCTVASGGLAGLGYGGGFGLLAAGLGFVMVLTGAAYVEFASKE